MLDVCSGCTGAVFAESLGEQSSSDVSVHFTLIINQHVLLSDELLKHNQSGGCCCGAEERISIGAAKQNETNAKLSLSQINKKTDKRPDPDSKR